MRLKEHKRDMRSNADHSALVIHANKNYQIGAERGFSHHIKVEKIERLQRRRTNETINIRVGSMKWAKSAAVFSIANVRSSLLLSF